MNILLSVVLKRKFKKMVKDYTLKAVIHALKDFCEKESGAGDCDKQFAEGVVKLHEEYLERRKHTKK